MLLMLDPRPQS